MVGDMMLADHDGPALGYVEVWIADPAQLTRRLILCNI